MFPGRCSGSFSSRSLGGCPRPSCDPSRPSNLVFSRDLCAPGTRQPGPALHSGRQDTCPGPSSRQTPRYDPRAPTPRGPCGTPDFGGPGCGPGSSYFVVCGPSGSRPQGRGLCGLPPLSSGSGSRCAAPLPPRGRPSPCLTPACGSRCFYPSTCYECCL